MFEYDVNGTAIKPRIPNGAAYYSNSYDTLTFWRERFTHYNSLNEERLQRMSVWQYYERGTWIDDSAVSTRRFKSITTYNEDKIYE